MKKIKVLFTSQGYHQHISKINSPPHRILNFSLGSSEYQGQINRLTLIVANKDNTIRSINNFLLHLQGGQVHNKHFNQKVVLIISQDHYNLQPQ